MAWGNLTGIRVDGHLFELNSSMCIAQPDWAGVFTTGREKQTNSYSRNGKTETVTFFEKDDDKGDSFEPWLASDHEVFGLFSERAFGFAHGVVG